MHSNMLYKNLLIVIFLNLDLNHTLA